MFMTWFIFVDALVNQLLLALTFSFSSAPYSDLLLSFLFIFFNWDHSSKAEQPLTGIELIEKKEEKDEKHLEKLFSKNQKIKNVQ